jgi:hypothetical protein
MTSDLFVKQNIGNVFFVKCEFDHFDNFGKKIAHLGIKNQKKIKKNPLFMTQMNA